MAIKIERINEYIREVAQNSFFVKTFTRSGVYTPPTLYVCKEDPTINAEVNEIGDEYRLTITQGTLTKLTEEQFKAVLAHEFSHLKNKDFNRVHHWFKFEGSILVAISITLLLLFVKIIGLWGILAGFAFPLLSVYYFGKRSFSHWHKIETRCDGDAGRVCGYHAIIEALAEIALESNEALIETARERMSSFFSKHPTTEHRIKHLQTQSIKEQMIKDKAERKVKATQEALELKNKKKEK